jgi:hypothetical protein
MRGFPRSGNASEFLLRRNPLVSWREALSDESPTTEINNAFS